jgi:hypothetical protein
MRHAVPLISFRPKGAVVSYLKRANSGHTLTYSSGHIHIDTGRG